MADNTDLLNQIISKLDEQARETKAVRQDVAAVRREHGEKLDKLDAKADRLEVKVDRLEDGQNRQLTAMKILQGAIEETRAVVDKILHRPRQAD